ncbi:MAG TPA: hypothetical protein VGC09_00200 [Rhodopila sp.]
MKLSSISPIVMGACLLVAVPALAQPATQKPHTQATPTTTGATKVSKQHTDGDSPTVVGPASKAYKQQTQSLSHSDGTPRNVVKQN